MKQYTVKQARFLKSISQEDMAKMLKISPNAYRNKEKGLSEFTFSEASNFANIVDLDLKQIFFGKNVT